MAAARPELPWHALAYPVTRDGSGSTTTRGRSVRRIRRRPGCFVDHVPEQDLDAAPTRSRPRGQRAPATRAPDASSETEGDLIVGKDQRSAIGITLLDLHNIYVSWRNGGPLPADYVAALDPSAVLEIHLAGGGEFLGFYMDSHCDLPPPDGWDLAYAVVPGFMNL